MIPEPLTDTTEFPRSSPSHQGPAPIPSYPTVEADIAGSTHTGKIRGNNEDNFLVVRFGRFLQTMLTSLPAAHLVPDHSMTGYGMAIADGMGGMAAGEVASRLAITVLIDLVLETPDWMMGQEEHHVDEVAARTIERFERINQSVLEQARSQPWLKGMGTTLTFACSLGANLLIVHLGDSPVYLLRRGALHRLTRDHTLAQEMADIGSIPVESVPLRYRHTLTQAIGIRDDAGDPDICRLALDDGDRLLLCSDGLTDMVDDTAIAALLKDGETSAIACQSLIDLALKHGGRDNITAIVATYRIAPRA